MQVIRDFDATQFDGVCFLAGLALREAVKHFYHDMKYLTASDAPNDWEALQAYKGAERGNCALVVYEGHSGKTIYGNHHTLNHLARAYHDCIHLENNLSFSYEDEEQTARIQAAQMSYVIHSGLASSGEYSTKYLSTFIADLVFAEAHGQSQYHKKHGEFPDNQKAFVEECCRYGIKKVIQSGVKY